LADEVDHVVPISTGGEDEESNYQALCKTHHSRKTFMENKHGESRPQVIAVVGPPGGGKSSYVEKHRMYGDPVWDFDRVAAALLQAPIHEKTESIVPLVLHLQAAFYGFCRKPSGLRRIWILATCRTEHEREQLQERLDCDIIRIEPTEAECLLNISRDPARKDRVEEWKPIVRAWFEAREKEES